MASLIERIQEFNRDREPQRLQLKYQKMRSDAFVFLRSTCHLFYEDWSAAELDQAPLSWICGDLHLENFGVYKAGNGLTYFNINDFDEAVLAPCTWDLARFLTSVLLGAETLKGKPDALRLCDCFLQSYQSALRQGTAQWAERKTPVEVVQNLLDQLAERDRKKLLDQRTRFDRQKKQRQFYEAEKKDEKKRILPLLDGQQERLKKFMPEFSATYLAQQEATSQLFQQLDGTQIASLQFFNLLDAARRIAGGGSLGLERYALLVEGEGSPDGNYLLDLKQAQPAALEPYLHSQWKQPAWKDAADRIVSIQTRVQAFTPALLSSTTLSNTPYILKELQPTKEPTDRVELKKLGSTEAQLEKLMALMGRVVAWGTLRSSGYQGAATVDQRVDFAESKRWQKPLMEYAHHSSDRVRQDWREFSKAYDDGVFQD
jgi:uncharacterized protein (DUF2252 family)